MSEWVNDYMKYLCAIGGFSAPFSEGEYFAVSLTAEDAELVQRFLLTHGFIRGRIRRNLNMLNRFNGL